MGNGIKVTRSLITRVQGFGGGKTCEDKLWQLLLPLRVDRFDHNYTTMNNPAIIVQNLLLLFL